jgi:hypothetical protein
MNNFPGLKPFTGYKYNSSFKKNSGNLTCIDFSQAMNFELNLNTQKMEKEKEKEKCMWE